MIWFACPKCQKVHGRPENAVGAMVFCDCGNGLTVPWESTAPEPAHVPAVVTPQARPVEPISFGGSSQPASTPSMPPPRPRGRRARYEYDPNKCLNHESRPKQKTCADCGLSFCDDCVVSFRGQTLCGPCKNFESKLLQRPIKSSAMALASAAAAFGAGVLILCMPWSKPVLFTAFAMAALGIQALAFLAGLFAFRKSQADPLSGGQGLAVTGMSTSAFMSALTLVFTIYAQRLGS